MKWLFVAVVLVQLAVPASQISKHEQTLRKGDPYKFRTAPVDPFDAFRGRYVALRFEQNEAQLPAGVKVTRGQTVYAAIEVDADGFARFGAATLSAPEGKPYLRTRAGYSTGTGKVRLQLPFDRFYMEEKMAPVAERAYQEHGSRDAYVVVRVRGGRGVIENLYVAGQPIAEFVRGK